MKRQTEWFDFILEQNGLAANAQLGLRLDNSLAVTEKKGITLVRTIIDINVQAGTTGANLELFLGISLISEDSFVAASLPDPLDDDEQAGWLYRKTVGLAASVLFDHSQTVQVVADIHAMRKYPGEDFLLCLTLERDAAAGSLNVFGQVRLLYKKT